jgi:hypothetical protein
MINKHNAKILKQLEESIKHFSNQEDNIAGFFLIIPLEETQGGYWTETVDDNNLCGRAIIDMLCQALGKEGISVLIQELQAQYKIKYETAGEA